MGLPSGVLDALPHGLSQDGMGLPFPLPFSRNEPLLAIGLDLPKVKGCQNQCKRNPHREQNNNQPSELQFIGQDQRPRGSGGLLLADRPLMHPEHNQTICGKCQPMMLATKHGWCDEL